MRWRVLSVLMALAPLGAHAAGGTNQAVGQAIWNAATKGKTTTIAPGGKLTTIAPAGGGGSPIGQVSTAGNTASGGVAVAGAGTAPVNGKGVPVSVTGTISKDVLAQAAAAGVCAVASAGVCIGAAAAVAALPHVLNWIDSAGVRRNAETGAFERDSTDGAVQSDGYRYYTSWQPPGQPTQYFSSPIGACQGMAGQWSAANDVPMTNIRVQGSQCLGQTGGNPNYPFTSVNRGDASDCPAGYYITPYGCFSAGNLPKVAVSPTQLVDLLKSGGAPDPGVVQELTGQGQSLPVGDVSVSGPSSVSGPTTISITNTTNNNPVTTTTTTTNHYTYNGNSVTNTGTTTNKEVKDKDGNTVSTEEETTNPGDEQQPEDAAVDTPLGAIPKLYERKYPNGMEGIWNDYSGQIKQSSMFTFASKLMPNLGDGGSCPSWMVNLNWSSWIQYGVHDVAPPCWIWDVARAIIIFSALLLARALIFGG